MAFQYPSYVVPQPSRFTLSDIVDGIVQSFDQGQQRRQKDDARKLLADYGAWASDSLAGNDSPIDTSAKVASIMHRGGERPPGVVDGSVDAGIAASDQADPRLKTALLAKAASMAPDGNGSDVLAMLGQAVGPAAAAPSTSSPQPGQGMRPQASDVLGAIGQAINPTGAPDFSNPALAGYVASVGQAESSGDPNAQSDTSSAGGLFGFTTDTWNRLVEQNPGSGLTPDGKMDPAQQRIAMALLTRGNASGLRQAGVGINPATLYTAHFLGLPTATRVLAAAPDTPMPALVTADVLQANPNLQKMTAGDFLQWAGQKATGASGGYAGPMLDANGGWPQPMGRQVPLPPRDLLRALVMNEDTRQLGLSLIDQARKGQTIDQYQRYTAPDGVIYQVDMATGEASVLHDPTKSTTGSADGGDVSAISDAIISGQQPPSLTGLYRYAAPVRADLARKGYDLTKANQDWTATQKLLGSLNGPQQTRLRQAVNFASDSLDSIQGLAEQWKAGQFPTLNKVQLQAAKQGLLGQDAASLATRLEAQIADLVSELGTVYKGGNSSTDESLRLAASNLNANWSEQTLLDAIDMVRTNLGYRRNSLNLSTGGIPDSQYNPVTSGSQPGAGGDVARPQSQEDYDALPSGTPFIDPDSGETLRKP